VPDERPAGAQIATTKRRDGTTLYHFARDHDQVVLRYPRLCEFIGGPTLSDIMIYMHPGVDPGNAPVLIGGAVIALHLRLRNELVLHASAVRAGDRAVAFVGASGMGKSTLAAALCRNGYDLVTDDVLRVDLTGGTTPRALPGSTENRLRPSARQLVDDAPAHPVRPTADGRVALRSRACSPGSKDLVVHWVPQAAALLRLLRIVGSSAGPRRWPVPGRSRRTLPDPWLAAGPATRPRGQQLPGDVEPQSRPARRRWLTQQERLATSSSGRRAHFALREGAARSRWPN
jgi:hypothetical protein